MKTRFSALVSLKKNAMQKSERVVQNANKNLFNAKEALRESLAELQNIPAPQQGIISDFLANRTLLDSQRAVISHNESWVEYAQKELLEAKEQLKRDMIEYEKFNYLELQEIEKMLQAKKLQETKDLDEVALMTYSKKTNIIRQAS
ncbi:MULTISPECIES: flagellar export protein FliJ [Sulfurimonas]|uniref:flagellar export protein FliJ n=1 Tax=Sulfurimonas TaxID=202746 RepID=UPI00126405DF|nr:flagellar export protein FliJ [Sulfurimonas indica]